MTGSKPTNTRRLISTLVMLAILGSFLSIYFLKYVPQQRRDYNQRAFRELLGVTRSFKSSANALQEMFKNKEGLSCPIIRRESTGSWNLIFRQVSSSRTNKKTAGDSIKSLSGIMRSLTAGDDDVFDSYLMIVDTLSGKDTMPKHPEDASRSGQIAYNPDHLSLGYSINTDTLLKSPDGFSLSNIRDVKIEGNDYKLFFYPFWFHQQKVIMAGLLSLSHYTERYESVPADFVTTGGILFLLLLVAIPLLKIYIIGSHERITTFDLRMIIGTYYIGGFILFFLFIWTFLEGSQTARNKRFLTNFTAQLAGNLTTEISTACRQLRSYDDLYHSDSNLRRKLDDPVYDPAGLDTMRPAIYKQLKKVFWIDSNGKWVGRYGFMHFDTFPLISSNDRQYFRDMKDSNVLHIKNNPEDFCLQPVLSKLDASFVVNVIIRSRPAELPPSQRAIMLGLSSEMYSVCNTVLPPGYGFSIIDATGNILFDPRDRNLLTNIYTDLRDEKAIGDCVRYRQERFFRSTALHGTNVALLATPLDDLPYTVLAYYDLDRDHRFQSHVLGISCFFIGCIILLLFLSAWCNEWVRSKATLSSIPSVNFEWLRPAPAKTGYYRHLLRGTGWLAAGYCLPWLAFQRMNGQHATWLFVVTILFPFYLTIHYVLLREQQKPANKRLARLGLAGALGIPLLVILTVMTYVLPGELSIAGKLALVTTQLIFIGIIGYSLRTFRPAIVTADKDKMLNLFVQAVVAGILLVVIIPASGIFSFFYKEETGTRIGIEKFDVAGLVTKREDSITASLANYAFRRDKSDLDYFYDLKFRKGIYLPDNTPPESQAPPLPTTPALTSELYYTLHNFLFPGDYTLHLPGETTETAAGKKEDVIRLPLAPMARQSSLRLMFDNSRSMGTANFLLFLLIVGLSIAFLYWLTWSLASRIFLLRIFDNYPPGVFQTDMLTNANPPATASAKLLQKMTAAGFPVLSVKNLKAFEEQNPEYNILYAQNQLTPVYKDIWTKLTPREKFVLYDFAIDSLANYKAGRPLYNLIEKGILYLGTDRQLCFAIHSFHNYVLNQSENKVIVQQLKRAREQGSWQNIKNPLLVILAATGLFVFFTQNDVYQKITGLITSLGSILPVITQFFSKGNK